MAERLKKHPIWPYIGLEKGEGDEGTHHSVIVWNTKNCNKIYMAVDSLKIS